MHLRDAPYGHLYLADKADGQEFTATDEETAVALARAAALAIENSGCWASSNAGSGGWRAVRN